MSLAYSLLTVACIIALFSVLRFYEMKKEPTEIENVRKAKAMMEWYQLIRCQIQSAKLPSHFAIADGLIERFKESYLGIEGARGIIEELNLMMHDRRMNLKLNDMYSEELFIV